MMPTNTTRRFRMIPRVERSRVDDRWCVYTYRFESLCPAWMIPAVWLWAVFA